MFDLLSPCLLTSNKTVLSKSLLQTITQQMVDMQEFKSCDIEIVHIVGQTKRGETKAISTLSLEIAEKHIKVN